MAQRLTKDYCIGPDDLLSLCNFGKSLCPGCVWFISSGKTAKGRTRISIFVGKQSAVKYKNKIKTSFHKVKISFGVVCVCFHHCFFAVVTCVIVALLGIVVFCLLFFLGGGGGGGWGGEAPK